MNAFLSLIYSVSNQFTKEQKAQAACNLIQWFPGFLLQFVWNWVSKAIWVWWESSFCYRKIFASSPKILLWLPSWFSLWEDNNQIKIHLIFIKTFDWKFFMSVPELQFMIILNQSSHWSTFLFKPKPILRFAQLLLNCNITMYSVHYSVYIHKIYSPMMFQYNLI